MDNRNILIWLNSICGIGNKTIDKLEEHFGSLNSLWSASKNDLKNINFMSDTIIERIINTRNEDYISILKEKIDEFGAKVMTIYDDDYPNILKNIYNPPKVLYIKGNICKNDDLSISIVGSRKATTYGKWAANKFARELSRIGITVISGMARGIDTEVHKGVLLEGGRTIAVLGSGINVIYPRNNKELYNKIIDNGAVISEFPFDMEPLSQNFPQRNRIISGLSLGVIVIEASEKSGSLITVEHALDQGKEVFALPGNINSIYSKGTNRLIKEGAKILTDIDDILEEIIQIKEKRAIVIKEKIDYRHFSQEEVKILKCISQYPMYCDNIALNTGMSISKVHGILSVLEIKGVVKQLPGKLFTINS